MAEYQPISTHPRFQDLTGQQFGRLRVLGFAGFRGKNAQWHCECSCPKKTRKAVAAGQLKSGHTLSCGCLHVEQLVARCTKHGMAGTSEYRIWRAMIDRCTNPKQKHYRWYGGRGIRVCERWRLSFAAFYADMGPRPSPRHSIDRFPDNDGDYCPENCRWATPSQQSRNTRRSRSYTFDGKTQCLTDWAKEYGISEALLRKRLDADWDLGEAVLTPPTKAQPVEFNGQSKLLTEWAKEYGVSIFLVRSRLNQGWNLGDALTVPNCGRGYRRPGMERR